jgi:hypothetical protein
MALLRVTQEEEKKLEEEAPYNPFSIETDDILVSMSGWSDQGASMAIKDKIYGGYNYVFFNLKWWPSFTDFYTWENKDTSGHYIFRPRSDMYLPLTYTNYLGGEVTKGPNHERITLYLGKEGDGVNTTEKVIIHISIDPDFPVVRFDVDLDSLPKPVFDGFEVGVEWTANWLYRTNQTFYTDSNGLAMQKRVLNYRPTWDIEANYNESNQNITANYYPVTSAISINDLNYTFTVNTDTTHGGTSLQPGVISLMQNRRIPARDSSGVNEFLDEVDEFGNGIRTKSTYYVQYYQQAKRDSYQRLVQTKIDAPLQYFFSFNVTTAEATEEAGLRAEESESPVRIQSLPKKKNQLMIRVENLSDDEAQTVNLTDFVQAMYTKANPMAPKATVNFTEMSLSGNMPLTEMLQRKIHWKTDNNLVSPRVESALTPEMLLVQPLSIRVIQVDVNPSAEFEKFMQF